MADFGRIAKKKISNIKLPIYNTQCSFVCWICNFPRYCKIAKQKAWGSPRLRSVLIYELQ